MFVVKINDKRRVISYSAMSMAAFQQSAFYTDPLCRFIDRSDFRDEVDMARFARNWQGYYFDERWKLRPTVR